MTRSQQELSFESGCPPDPDDQDLEDSGLDTITASPSRILNRQSLLVRQSKGNPLYAKPVGIPIVPRLEPTVKDHLMKMEPKPVQPPISPHKINNFVYEEDNRIILDFGTDNNIENDLRGQSPNHSESSKSTSSLLAKMKEKKNTLKKSLSNVSNGGTLRRKKSAKMMSSSSNISPSSTLSSTASITHTSMTSLPPMSKSVVKPSCAPPPPPPQITKPSSAPPPPPPPIRTVSVISVASEELDHDHKITINGNGQDDVVKPLEEFRIDLNTESVMTFYRANEMCQTQSMRALNVAVIIVIKNRFLASGGFFLSEFSFKISYFWCDIHESLLLQ